MNGSYQKNDFELYVKYRFLIVCIPPFRPMSHFPLPDNDLLCSGDIQAESE